MNNNYYLPEKDLAELFIDIHESCLWSDGKAISDANPKRKPTEILADYRSKKEKKDFDLKVFFYENFDLYTAENTNFKSDTSKSTEEHIEVLWDVLKRDPIQTNKISSLVSLPNSYIVPGGRFNEIYYWDSYFTMLGLQVSKKISLIQDMVDNFSFMINQFGFIPNGNRTYFLGRSQPPFYSLMIQLLAEELGNHVYESYLPYLEKEYLFWMNGSESLSENNKIFERVVYLESEGILNRYWDNFSSPRPEMYSNDMEILTETNRDSNEFFRDIRGACESGWDFSSRWLRDKSDLGTIHTSEIIPVDLNCLLLNLERVISLAYQLKGNIDQSNIYLGKANNRKKLILKYCWDEENSFFKDYDFVENNLKNTFSLAGIFPLFFEVSEISQSKKVSKIIEKHFLKDGGLISTTNTTDQQWDAPNGWAPLQYIAIKGLKNYGFDDLANKIKFNWLSLNQKIYKKTGKMLEKYNVENIDLETGGGEYPVQDGFGWTNGVFLKLSSMK